MKKVKTIGIVSLSSGILGEDFVQHEVKIGLERLEKLGIQVKFMEHACKGLKYISEHPEDRASDLLNAFQDDSIDMILCAIGGDDTYRLLPYLFEHDELKNAVKEKIFLGFSDTTFNHLMLHKVGLNTFYGQAFLPDVCELDEEMLPYTEKYFLELLETGKIHDITPSDVWYEERSDYSAEAVGTKRIMHTNKGFELLQGSGVFQGKILGGCIDSLYDIFDKTRHSNSVELCRKYNLLFLSYCSLEYWNLDARKILPLTFSLPSTQFVNVTRTLPPILLLGPGVTCAFAMTVVPSSPRISKSLFVVSLGNFILSGNVISK